MLRSQAAGCCVLGQGAYSRIRRCLRYKQVVGAPKLNRRAASIPKDLPTNNLANRTKRQPNSPNKSGTVIALVALHRNAALLQRETKQQFTSTAGVPLCSRCSLAWHARRWKVAYGKSSALAWARRVPQRLGQVFRLACPSRGIFYLVIGHCSLVISGLSAARAEVTINSSLMTNDQ